MPNPNPKGKTYLLKGVPVDIYEAAQAKAAANRPPLSMRWVLITLLEKWVDQRPPSADAPPRVFKPRKAKTAKKAKPEPATENKAGQTHIEPRQGIDDVDLTDSF